MHILRVFWLIFFLSGWAVADELYIYPAKGQSQDQEEQDKFQCYQFGKKQTGFDPMKAPTATSQEPESQGGAGRGILRGALLGVAIGAATGNAGRGAAIGAAGGGLIGGMRRRHSREQQQQWADDQTAQYAGNRDNYNRAYSACLEGRGYTVK